MAYAKQTKRITRKTTIRRKSNGNSKKIRRRKRR